MLSMMMPLLPRALWLPALELVPMLQVLELLAPVLAQSHTRWTTQLLRVH
jgi:hypothetical protein